MPDSPSDHSVVVTHSSVESEDPYDLIHSNITFVNALLHEHFLPEELSPNALRSYYVDYYLAEVNNGGFSQFVYNSRWEPTTIRCVREGLREMGATKHLELFNESASIIDRIGPDEMDTFLESEYFGENNERDILNEFNDKFCELCDTEDLIELNSQWLRKLPELVVVSEDEMKVEVERRASALPDRKERAAKALANEPRFMKLIRALCAASGQELSRVTAGDPTHQHNGEPTLAWHFLTDAGHYYMVDSGGKAIMFHGNTHEKIVDIDATDDFGTE